ncbi:MAG: hypothetical protein H7317_05215, partial [Pseudorhodobacter sp.]|nr:hypothetical protein [Pseudorhodobacter sp.]
IQQHEKPAVGRRLHVLELQHDRHLAGAAPADVELLGIEPLDQAGAQWQHQGLAVWVMMGIGPVMQALCGASFIADILG